MKLLFLLLTISGNADPGIIPQPYLLPLMHWCAETGIPVYIATAVIENESSWIESKVSFNPAWKHRKKSWDRGLMQLNSLNEELFSKAYNGGRPIDWLDPSTNMKIGLRFLRDIHDKYGTWRRALNFYNSGSADNPPASTKKLVDAELGG